MPFEFASLANSEPLGQHWKYLIDPSTPASDMAEVATLSALNDVQFGLVASYENLAGLVPLGETVATQ